MPNSPEIEPHEFAARLREAMGTPKRGDAAKLAKRHKVSRPTVNGWLSGNHLPEPNRVKLMAQDYDVNFKWLFFGEGQKKESAGNNIGEPDRPAYHKPINKSEVIDVPQFDISGSMGVGNFTQDHIDVVQQISVNINQLRRQVAFSSVKNLSFITGYGPSMEPTFFDGDILLVDTGVTALEIDAVYVFYLNGMLYIKTLQRRPDGSVLMISDNKRYEPYRIDSKDELQIQGRILIAWNARRL